MQVPGSNLLNRAFSLIGTTDFQYLPYLSRELNAVGQYVAIYGTPISVDGSVQAVNRQTYVEWGLDFQKKYMLVYASIETIDLDRDVTGDRFILPGGKIYQIDSQVDWFLIDGWIGALCIKVDTP